LPALKAFKKLVDPDEHNGASMVGLNGVVIKSHGSAGAYSFGNAIRVAVIEARKGVPTQIIELLKAQSVVVVSESASSLQVQEQSS
jgi:phosphate acyltransferase